MMLNAVVDIYNVSHSTVKYRSLGHETKAWVFCLVVHSCLMTYQHLVGHFASSSSKKRRTGTEGLLDLETWMLYTKIQSQSFLGSGEDF